MDPISQGSLGAALSQSASNKDSVKAATLFGCFGGLAPDLDILISSPTDPLLFLEFHRQFTHSLVFVPIGALLVTLVLYRWLGKDLSFKQSYLFCLLGYATHGLLDACTSYGTQLLWPFSSERFAWNNVSIIDPFFTIPILALIILGVRRKQPLLARFAFVWAIAYLSFGVFQRERAISIGNQLAESRGHTPIRLEAKPGFANLILWKVIYETNDHFYVDAVRVGISHKSYTGDRVEKLSLAGHFPWLDQSSQQAKDVERFRWFSNGYLAMDSDNPNRIIDIRYSVVPNEINALWGIELDPEKPADAHVTWLSLRSTKAEQTTKWWRMLTDWVPV